MDKLIAIYEQMKKLRETGVKMKDISEETDIAASVLSSLYSSVLPAYINMISNGEESDRALDDSLALVNNVSKRKLLGSIDSLYDTLLLIRPKHGNGPVNTHTFIDDMEKESVKCASNIGIYEGLYTAYSASSFSDGLKIEPYLIPANAENDTIPTVYSQSMSGEFYSGIGIFSRHQIGYMLFNEQKRLQFTLKVIYLQLPVFEHPNILKGIYLTNDYNGNPISRRIIFVKEKDDASLEEFAQMRTTVIPKDKLNEEQMKYYKYACENIDVIRSVMMESPDKDIEGLLREKRLLKLL